MKFNIDEGFIQRLKIRQSSEYRHFRKTVLERDNYSCQRCGLGKFNILKYPQLHVHHIKSFKDYPELRLEPSNCITLCKDCHKLTDSYWYPGYIKRMKQKISDLNFWY